MISFSLFREGCSSGRASEYDYYKLSEYRGLKGLSLVFQNKTELKSETRLTLGQNLKVLVSYQAGY